MSYSDMQVMITLASVAYLDMKPSGTPTVAGQEQQLLSDIQCVLDQDGLATGCNWTIPWVGLSDDQANFAYIAQNKTTGDLAVVLRGSVFNANPESAGRIDMLEDFDVWSVKELTACGETVHISAGAHDALRAVTLATCTPEAASMQGKTVLGALRPLGAGPADGPLVYVTGHSLGGCLTATVALYLLDELEDCIFQVYNFAGPTAGLQDFADLFDAKFGGSSLTECSSWRVVNVWDAVPHA